MNLRAQSALLAILAVAPFPHGATAQEPLYSAHAFHTAPDTPAWRYERLAVFESDVERPESPPSRDLRLDEGLRHRVEARPVVLQDDPVALPVPRPVDVEPGPQEYADTESFTDRFSMGQDQFGVGVDFYSPPEFEGGILVFGRNVALKIGGYVKADFIYDFNPIDSTDTFVTTDIPVGARHRTNARFHARQSRLSFDTRWETGGRTVRIYVEGDFFSEGDRYRLRHAYGESGRLLVGRYWTTFTDVAAAPATLDFEGSVSSVDRRQAQARWTQPIFCDDVTLAVAIEDARFIIEAPPGLELTPRTPSPDFAAHLRLQREWGRFQIAGLYRLVGVQPRDREVFTGDAWGLNFTGVLLLPHSTKAYYQIVFGNGIGSYRGLPDAAPTASDRLAALPLFGWMVGVTHNWTDDLSSNFTYAENYLDNTALQPPDDVHRTTYLAVNLIWKPVERVRVGIEYLYGLRENIDSQIGAANRVQTSFIFDLP